ncbi:TPA: hypothetical protein ACF5NP_000784 [Enterococcus faecium]|uniref:hypothetical protein n=1 Tax=Enterococcus TaxID=1350 RepID=UPI000DEA13FE|nr:MULTISPECIES: hypothetical protein [Enterococcus]MEB4597871.1 hypothetical protein [Enterococcus sp. E4-85]RBS57510.1 hypothetical protein EB35_00944 [Enterococcus faecium]
MNIKLIKVVELMFWLVSYSPVFMIILYNFFIKSNKTSNLVQVACFIMIIIITVILYKVTLSIFMKIQIKKIKTNQQKKLLKLRHKESLSLEQYSFFILSLMLPFIFESTESLFDLLLILSLVCVIISVMIKMDQIIVNPIFLFSKIGIYKGEIQIIGTNKSKKVAFITNISENDLEDEENLRYHEYFNNVYLLLKN